MLSSHGHAVPKAVPDAMGTSFVFTTPLCQPDSPASMFLVPQSTACINVTVTYHDRTTDHFTIPEDGVLRSPLPCPDMKWNTLSDEVFELETSAEVMLYIEYTDDCHYVHPVDSLATSFTTSSVPSPDFGVYFFILIANGTDIEISIPDAFPTFIEFNGTKYNQGASLNISIPSSKYQTIAMTSTSNISGINIRATSPVSMLVGAYNTDTLIGVIEPLPPTSAWGRRFIYSGHSWMAGEMTLSITGKAANTDVNITQPDRTQTLVFSGRTVVNLHLLARDFVAIEANSSILCVILCRIRDTNNNSHFTMIAITPVMLFHVSSSFISGNSDEASVNLLLTSHSFSSISFNRTPVINPFHRPMIYFWKLFLCNEVTLTDPYVITTNNKNVSPFYAVVLHRNKFAAHAYSLGMRITSIYDACVITVRPHGGNGDGIDNDCDNNIDEEWLNGKDDDGDGAIDEDVRYSGSKDTNVVLDNGWLYHQENKDVNLGISNSVLSVVISIVVALVAVGCFLGGMLLAERIRMIKETARVTPLNT